MGDTKISEAVDRLELAYISGMDEEFRDDLRVILDYMSAPQGKAVAFIAQCELDVLREGRTYAWTPPVWSRPTGDADLPLYAHPQPAALNEVSGGHELARAVEKALGNRDGKRDAELDELLEMAMQELNAIDTSMSDEVSGDSGELPPLPEAFEAEFTMSGNSPVSVYTAQQMQDYARAALAATGKQQVGEVQGD